MGVGQALEDVCGVEGCYMFSLVLEAWTQVYVGVADLDDSVDGP